MTRDEFLETYAAAHRRRRAEGDVCRPILVGEDNPYSARASDALLPYPPNAAGSRLVEIVGLGAEDYLARFDRVNLCRQRWSNTEARERAQVLLEHARRGTPLVLLGQKVCMAFLQPYAPFSSVRGADGVRLVILPHPSGRNRVWNELDAVDKARTTLRAEGLIP